jgi:hypothetical protein
MRTFLTLLPALACAAMMFVCARMMFGHREESTENAGAQEVAELREEVARLRAQRTLEEEHVDG